MPTGADWMPVGGTSPRGCALTCGNGRPGVGASLGDAVGAQGRRERTRRHAFAGGLRGWFAAGCGAPVMIHLLRRWRDDAGDAGAASVAGSGSAQMLPVSGLRCPGDLAALSHDGQAAVRAIHGDNLCGVSCIFRVCGVGFVGVGRSSDLVAAAAAQVLLAAVLQCRSWPVLPLGYRRG